MGHKVNPLSFRLTSTKDWRSKWFEKNAFSKNLKEDLEIRRSIDKKYGKLGGLGKVEILRDHESITINIFTSKPGIIIGRSGQGINELRAFIMKDVSQFRTTPVGKLPKIKIEVNEIRNPEIWAQLVAQNIANQIEKRIAFKRAIKQAIEKAIEGKAKGIKVQIAGRLGGAEIARTEKYGQNSVPLGRFKADIDFGQAVALTTYGTIGIKVWIYKGDKIQEKEE